MPGKFEIFKDKKGEFRFHLKATNGEIILASEGYKAKTSCKNGVESVRKNAANANRFETKVQKNGKAYFVLTATNGQVIGVSQGYKSAAACKIGVKSVTTNAPKAKVDDKTV